jgi:glutathione S-transferase
MRLYVTTTSPFARKCRLVARERGLAGRVEEVLVDPYANDPVLVEVNPIAQVPAFDDGRGLVLTDSPLICAYLDQLGEGPGLVPPAGPEHWRARRREALADGALEMGVKWLLELRRPETERSPSWIARWRAGLARALDQMEAEIPADAAVDLVAITAAVLLTWLDFRHPTLDWRAGRPGLAALQARMEARESFKATVPG